MQTFRSTVKLTTQFYYENRETHAQFWISILAIAFVFVLALLFASGIIPSRFSPERTEFIGWTWLIAVVAAIIVTVFTHLNRKFYPHIQRIKTVVRIRRWKELYGTSTPTLETWLEGNTVITRCIETGREDRFRLRGLSVHQTANYIIVRASHSKTAPFAKSDFTDEELAALLSALEAAECDILPNS